jgi:nitroreductase
MAEFDRDQTDRLLTTTRAVRRRLDLARPVEASVVLECLTIATQAPSGSNGQRWRWMLVTDADKKRVVGEYYARSFAAYMAPKADLIDPGDGASTKMAGSARFLAEHMAEVPMLVIPCTLDRLAPGAGAEEEASLYGGILPAVWSLQLALRSRGLGSAWTTLHLNYQREIGETLGIPDTVTQVALLPVAYYTGEGFRPAPRRPIGEVTYWNSWRERSIPPDLRREHNGKA